MSARIVVIDYKAGNLASVIKALGWLGAEAVVSADPEVIRRAGKCILPGVGHFAATRLLLESSVAEPSITEAVRESVGRGMPFLGICVGLQWLFAGSTEAPETPGLGHFEGLCERFSGGAKVPHVGWNSISVQPQSRLMRAVKDGEFVYYSHSYRAPVVKESVAVTDYAGAFSAAVEKGNVMGVQFHPEKSGATGMRVLGNFVEL